VVQPSALAASGACVHFDVPQLVACQPVCSSDLASSSGEETIEATFDVSTLLRFGRESQVKQLLFVIESPGGTLRVADYAPKTELASLYVGQIERSRQQEESTNAGLSASFAPTELLSAQGNASQSVKASESVRFQTLPPMQLLAASGTVARGTAVYFKFKSTPQTTLDGSRQVRVLFQVPTGWRADYVYLRCAAYDDAPGEQQGSLCSSSDFLVPLYRQGDEVAREAARELAVREAELRQLARQLQPSSPRSRSTSLSHKLSTLFREPSPRLPDTWLNAVLTSDADQREFAFQSQLPAPLRKALLQFADARWQVAELNR
jgi:hypothetical protein